MNYTDNIIEKVIEDAIIRCNDYKDAKHMIQERRDRKRSKEHIKLNRKIRLNLSI